VSEVVQQHNSMAETDSLSSQAHLIEMFTKSIDTPSSVDTLKSLGNMDKENMVAGLQRADALGIERPPVSHGHSKLYKTISSH